MGHKVRAVVYAVAASLLWACGGGTDSGAPAAAETSVDEVPAGWEAIAGDSRHGLSRGDTPGADKVVTYSAEDVPGAHIVVVPIETLDAMSWGRLQASIDADRRDGLDHALSIIAIDFAEIRGGRSLGRDYAAWGTAMDESGDLKFATRYQFGDTPPSIAVLSAPEAVFSQIDGKALITGNIWPAGASTSAQAAQSSVATETTRPQPRANTAGGGLSQIDAALSGG
ncbi:MAG: hypothetical protein AAFX86_07370 [Pseudomonadota bacterium]